MRATVERMDELVSLRRRRRVPGVGVVICISPTPLGPWRQEFESSGDLQVLRIDPGQSIDRLDLRCVVGLKVLVTDDAEHPNERAIRAASAACVAAGARNVVGVPHGSLSPGGLLNEAAVFDYRGGDET